MSKNTMGVIMVVLAIGAVYYGVEYYTIRGKVKKAVKDGTDVKAAIPSRWLKKA